MNLREAAQQALEALDADCGGRCNAEYNPCWQREVAETLRAALADTQDWDEIEALRASLREHMAEIHRLRTAGWHAYYALSEIDSPLLVREITRIGAAMSGLRAALAEEKNENTVQSTGGVHSRVSDGANCGVEAVTDCHEKAADHIPDATKMMASVREHRTVGATIKDCLIVEPVAYVTGYSKGRCIIEPVGYANKKGLFRCADDADEAFKASAIPLYATPPKREPLMDAHLTALCRVHWDRQANILDHIAYARAIERAHGIGGEE